MTMITVQHLSFRYESVDEPLFSDVSFAIDTNWKCGLIGKNGQGKTTLLQLLTGDLTGNGQIVRPVLLEQFPYPITDPEQMTIDVLAQASGAQNWQIEKECRSIGLREEVLWQPFSTLSPGEKVRAELASLFAEGDVFVLLDEPGNHLDGEGKSALSAYLKTKKGFLLVSHDRQLLDACVDHLLVIENGTIETRKGSYSAWHEEQEERMENDRLENKRLKKEIRRLEVSARESGNWSNAKEKEKIGAADKGFVGHKAAKLMKRSKAIEARKEKAVVQKRQLLKSLEEPETLKIETIPYKKDMLVRFEEASVDYGVWSSEPKTFSIGQGERIVLKGANGSGKSSLLKALMEEVPYKGRIEKGADLKISYVEQTPDLVRGSLDQYIAQYGIDRTKCMTILRKLGFSRDELLHPLDELSAGQRRKIMLARSLCEPAHLYVWDEPLNDLDIASREQIERMLRTGKCTMLFVEHDAIFCEKVATRTIVFGEKDSH